MRTRRLPTIPRLGWPAWLATLAAFALLCASVAYWAMQLLAPRAPIAPPANLGERQALPQLRLASQLFGVAASTSDGTPQPSNIVVLGVLAAGARGSAILAIDGKPAKAFGIGDRLSASQVLHQVRPGAVVIDAGGLRSELPAPLKPDMAVLTRGAARPAPDAQADAEEATQAPSPRAGVVLPPGVRLPPPPPPNSPSPAVAPPR